MGAADLGCGGVALRSRSTPALGQPRLASSRRNAPPPPGGCPARLPSRPSAAAAAVTLRVLLQGQPRTPGPPASQTKQQAKPSVQQARSLSCCAEPALNAWIANVADPLLSIDSRELLEALAALPACLPALQASAGRRARAPPCSAALRGVRDAEAQPRCALPRPAAAPDWQPARAARPPAQRRPACCPRCAASSARPSSTRPSWWTGQWSSSRWRWRPRRPRLRRRSTPPPRPPCCRRGLREGAGRGVVPRCQSTPPSLQAASCPPTLARLPHAPACTPAVAPSPLPQRVAHRADANEVLRSTRWSGPRPTAQPIARLLSHPAQLVAHHDDAEVLRSATAYLRTLLQASGWAACGRGSVTLHSAAGRPTCARCCGRAG